MRAKKIFPPTYPGARNNDPARHVFEYRRVDGRDVLCVLVDSVQSQANRLEEALKVARERGEVSFPTISVDFGKTAVPDIGQITALDAPHRVFDAIIRDSELDGKRFSQTDVGKGLVEAKSQSARALYDLAPTSLLFGAWNSTGEGGGLGAKFPRAIVSEIIGVGVATERGPSGEPKPSGKRTGSRVDPLGIRSGVKVFKTADGDWTLEQPDSKKGKAKELKPSEINHSNIAPSVDDLGVSVDYAIHTLVISFAALRRLRFRAKDGAASDIDAAGHAVLAALGLVAATAQDENGYFLRSRCDLVPADASSTFELVAADGTAEGVAIDAKKAAALLHEAVKRAASKDLRWSDKDVVLAPRPQLVELVRRSRERALQGEVDAEGEV